MSIHRHSHNENVDSQFGPQAHAYLASPVHAQGEDLERMAGLVGRRPDAVALDLGCGGGRDCFVLSSLVGERGKVIGVDATAEQIAFAQSYVEHHRKVFGHTESNVRFLQGNIEALDQLDLLPESIDVIVSNCVINLSMTKADVLAGMAKLLKPGGEIYFADIFSDRRLAPELKDDPLIVGECIGDALYFEDFVAGSISEPRRFHA